MGQFYEMHRGLATHIWRWGVFRGLTPASRFGGEKNVLIFNMKKVVMLTFEHF